MSGCQDCKRLIAALDKARDERDEARAALARYADPESWGAGPAERRVFEPKERG